MASQFDALLWKGSPHATTIQGGGIAIFGLAYLRCGIELRLHGVFATHCAVAIFSIPLVFYVLESAGTAPAPKLVLGFVKDIIPNKSLDPAPFPR